MAPNHFLFAYTNFPNAFRSYVPKVVRKNRHYDPEDDFHPLYTSEDLVHFPVLRLLRPELLATVHYFYLFGIHTGNARSVLYWTADDRCFAYGGNENAELGIGTTDNVPLDSAGELIPQEVRELSGQGVRCIAHGAAHVAALTRTGKVFTWGRNTRGQCGIGHSAIAMRPVLVLTGAKQLSCGRNHTVALLEDGTVHGTGEGGHSQLGPLNKHGLVKFTNLGLKSIIFIQCSLDATLALDDSEQVFHLYLPKAWTEADRNVMEPIDEIRQFGLTSLAVYENSILIITGRHDLVLLRMSDTTRKLEFGRFATPELACCVLGSAWMASLAIVVLHTGERYLFQNGSRLSQTGQVWALADIASVFNIDNSTPGLTKIMPNAWDQLELSSINNPRTAKFEFKTKHKTFYLQLEVMCHHSRYFTDQFYNHGWLNLEKIDISPLRASTVYFYVQWCHFGTVPEDWDQLLLLYLMALDMQETEMIRAASRQLMQSILRCFHFLLDNHVQSERDEYEEEVRYKIGYHLATFFHVAHYSVGRRLLGERTSRPVISLADLLLRAILSQAYLVYDSDHGHLPAYRLKFSTSMMATLLEQSPARLDHMLQCPVRVRHQTTGNGVTQVVIHILTNQHRRQLEPRGVVDDNGGVFGEGVVDEPQAEAAGEEAEEEEEEEEEEEVYLDFDMIVCRST